MPREPQIVKEMKLKKIAHRKRVVVKLVVGIIALLLSVVVVVILSRTQWLDVRTVQIALEDGTSMRYANSEQIRKVVEPKLLGENLFYIDIREVQRSILKADPFVETAYVEKKFPNGIQLNIYERVPFLLVESDRNCYLLDSNGYVLAKSLEATQEEQVQDCESMKAQYSSIHVTSSDIRADFPLGEQSTFFEVEKIELFVRALDDQGYQTNSIEIVDGIFLMNVGEDKLIIFSGAQDEDVQLKRFILVNSKIQEEGLTFRTLDLRYKRPVLKRI